MLNHIPFVLYHNIDFKKLKKVLREGTGTSNVVSTLIYNGKLANHIARLEATVVKYFTPNK